MAGRRGAAGRGRGLWALLLLLLLLLAARSGAAAASDLGKVMSIQPWLKMSGPCTDRHILTPHPHRRCCQLVALVMCGRSLELSQVDLALAIRWLREGVDALRRSPARERGPSRSPARGNGVYKSLLVRRSRLLSSGSGTVICPTHQIKKLQRYFKKKDLQARGKKWNEVGDGDGDGVLSPGSHGRGAVRRRRDISSREAAAGSAEVDMSLPGTSVQEREAEQGVSSNPVAGLHGGATTQVGTRGPGPQVFGSDSPRAPVRRSEGGEGAGKGGSGRGGRGDTTERGSGLGSLVSHDPALTGLHVSPHNHTAAPVTADPRDPPPPSANGQGQRGGMGGGVPRRG
ncbi:uncharacterized protein LOC116988693 [Amblyraja radiata]|uniref:uncharacterized protein LOC116988693 n=1 Tax=Amblyraja radiata TaxID=386614 RepID=UPI00140210DD|nr:uncharacterized protein LOC116988693 [Amblyraja radiata]